MGRALWPANTLWIWTSIIIILLILNSLFHLVIIFIQVDWETNVRKCHSIGMTPLLIENDKKRSCLNSWNTKGLIFDSQVEIDFTSKISMA